MTSNVSINPSASQKISSIAAPVRRAEVDGEKFSKHFGDVSAETKGQNAEAGVEADTEVEAAPGLTGTATSVAGIKGANVGGLIRIGSSAEQLGANIRAIGDFGIPADALPADGAALLDAEQVGTLGALSDIEVEVEVAANAEEVKTPVNHAATLPEAAVREARPSKVSDVVQNDAKFAPEQVSDNGDGSGVLNKDATEVSTGAKVTTQQAPLMSVAAEIPVEAGAVIADDTGKTAQTAKPLDGEIATKQLMPANIGNGAARRVSTDLGQAGEVTDGPDTAETEVEAAAPKVRASRAESSAQTNVSRPPTAEVSSREAASVAKPANLPETKIANNLPQNSNAAATQLKEGIVANPALASSSPLPNNNGVVSNALGNRSAENHLASMTETSDALAGDTKISIGKMEGHVLPVSSQQLTVSGLSRTVVSQTLELASSAEVDLKALSEKANAQRSTRIIEVQLMPRNLGLVAIKIQTIGGNVTIAIETQGMEAEKLIKTEVDKIASAIRQAGQVLEEISIKRNSHITQQSESSSNDQETGRNDGSAMNQNQNGGLWQSSDNQNNGRSGSGAINQIDVPGGQEMAGASNNETRSGTYL